MTELLQKVKNLNLLSEKSKKDAKQKQVNLSIQSIWKSKSQGWPGALEGQWKRFLLGGALLVV